MRDAQKTYQKLLAESCKTADGVQFDLGAYGNYYYITEPWGSPPYLVAVSYYGWNWTVRGDDENFVEIQDEPTKPDQRTRFIPIRSLYTSQRNAERALIPIMEKWLADHAADIAKAKAKIFPPSPAQGKA